MRVDIHEAARGRWRGILVALGVETKCLRNVHGPCPMCGGKDRWRWDDRDGRGTWICSRCGSGNGVDLVMKLRGVDFPGAKDLIETQVGISPVVAPKAEKEPADFQGASQALWRRGKPLDGKDIASRYLRGRGITLPSWPIYLRWIDALPHTDAKEHKTHWPAMLARFISPDNKTTILHRTWLAEPGQKAPVTPVRKMMMGRIPEGGAIRLAPPAETMGIAEGIETALAAHMLWRIPVWAATSAGALVKWRAPAICKCVIIFADADASYTGQMAAYNLAYRLKSDARLEGVEVRLPDYHDRGANEDWCDRLETAA